MGPYEKVKSTDFKHTVSAFLQIIYLRAFCATFPSSQPLTHSPFCKIIKSLKQTNTLKSRNKSAFFPTCPSLTEIGTDCRKKAPVHSTTATCNCKCSSTNITTSPWMWGSNKKIVERERQGERKHMSAALCRQ